MSSSGSSDDSDDDFAAELEATIANDGDDGGDAKRARTGDAPSSSIATREDAKTNDDDVDDACPPHPAFMFDICVRCGKRREKGDDDASGGGGGAGGGDKSTSMRYIHEGLELSASELEKAKREEKRRVLTSGKLLLVLDLDHTLLNSARFSELTQEQHDGLHRVIAAWECREKGGDDAAVAAAARDALLPPPPPPGEEEKEKATATEEKEEKDAKDANEEKDEKEEREADDGDATPETYPGTSPPLAELRCLRPLCMFTKLRPRAREFLRAASAMCQLYVYTMGDKNYAREMAKILDPTGELFNGRVIANSDSTCSRTKDLDIVLGAEGSVLIVDDTDRVWPHNLANLIRIDRYHFFPQSAAGFRQPGRSVLERAWKDEGANGDREQLRDVLRVIATAHAAFFRGTAAAGTSSDATMEASDTKAAILSDTKAAILSDAAPTPTPTPKRHWKVVSDDDARDVLDARDVRALLTVPGDGPLLGARLTFSRVVSVSEPRPERHPLWLLATSLGAEVRRVLYTGPHTTPFAW
jgi:RNA polymerase II C-terminal domain phosphatase-like 3/4